MKLNPVMMAALLSVSTVAAAPPPATPVTFRGALTGPMSSAVVTSDAIDIGTPAADRRVFVGVNAFATSAAFVSLKIGGVTADKLDGSPSSASRLIAFYSALVPTGTSATIELTLDATGQRYVFWTWVEDGSTSSTIHDTTGIVSVSASSVTVPVGFNIPTNGFALAVNWHNNTAAGGESDWTQNVGVINERGDLRSNGTGQWCSAADTFESGSDIRATVTNSQAAALNQILEISWAH